MKFSDNFNKNLVKINDDYKSGIDLAAKYLQEEINNEGGVKGKLYNKIVDIYNNRFSKGDFGKVPRAMKKLNDETLEKGEGDLAGIYEIDELVEPLVIYYNSEKDEVIIMLQSEYTEEIEEDWEEGYKPKIMKDPDVPGKTYETNRIMSKYIKDPKTGEEKRILLQKPHQVRLTKHLYGSARRDDIETSQEILINTINKFDKEFDVKTNYEVKFQQDKNENPLISVKINSIETKLDNEELEEDDYYNILLDEISSKESELKKYFKDLTISKYSNRIDFNLNFDYEEEKQHNEIYEYDLKAEDSIDDKKLYVIVDGQKIYVKDDDLVEDAEKLSMTLSHLSKEEFDKLYKEYRDLYLNDPHKNRGTRVEFMYNDLKKELENRKHSSYSYNEKLDKDIKNAKNELSSNEEKSKDKNLSKEQLNELNKEHEKLLKKYERLNSKPFMSETDMTMTAQKLNERVEIVKEFIMKKFPEVKFSISDKKFSTINSYSDTTHFVTFNLKFENDKIADEVSDAVDNFLVENMDNAYVEMKMRGNGIVFIRLNNKKKKLKDESIESFEAEKFLKEKIKGYDSIIENEKTITFIFESESSMDESIDSDILHLSSSVYTDEDDGISFITFIKKDVGNYILNN